MLMLAEEKPRSLAGIGLLEQDHGREWFEHVFMPILQRRPETVHEIALGVAIRATIASEFYRRISDDFFGLG